ERKFKLFVFLDHFHNYLLKPSQLHVIIHQKKMCDNVRMGKGGWDGEERWIKKYFCSPFFKGNMGITII
ncbi:MAG: hypothetical protein KGY50_03375, partial [Candidatus Thermoplasmatota archaeon]|nr:hypothetical protein [Candidatus Thermoplasmatota archaeon]